jgi:transposase InsO family protein
MKHVFIHEHRQDFRVKKMTEIIKVSRGGYYVKDGCKSRRQIENEQYLELIKIEFDKSRQTYGPRRLAKELKKNGQRIGRRRVEEIMRENNIVPKTVMKFKATTNSKHDYPVSPNLLNRNFKVDRLFTAWVSDITYIATREGWLYLAAVMDLYSGKIVGWAMSERMTQELVISALKQAVGRTRPPRGIILHSDRGVQYACKRYRNLVKSYGFRQSMSRKGDCWDNAPMESFFGTLKTELIYHEDYRTRNEARQSIFEYMEAFYNRVRLQQRLGYMSPVEFENLSKAA